MTQNIAVTILDQVEDKITGIIKYDIQVATSNHKWFLTKPFGEFEYLHRALEGVYHSLPKFPEQSIFAMFLSHFTESKENKQGELQKYMQGLVSRKDILASKALVNFLQLPKNSPQVIALKPKMLEEFLIDHSHDGGLPTKGIKDFYYDPQHQTFILLTIDTNPVSRIGSFLLNNVNIPWKNQKDQIKREVGSVQCWKKTTCNQNAKFKKLWSKKYYEQANVIEFNKTNGQLYVGLDDGSIDQLKVSVSQGYQNMKSIKTFSFHTGGIKGLFYDSQAQIIYSLSQNGYLISNQTLNNTTLKIIPHSISLHCLLVDKTNNRLFVGGDEGKIFVYDITKKGFPRLKITINISQNGAVESLCLDKNRNYLFATGSENGIVSTYDLDKPGNQRNTKQISVFEGKQNPKKLVQLPKRNEILVGMQDGSICVWNTLSGECVHLFFVHVQQITKMYYDQKNKVLITSAEGLQMRFWKLPQSWTQISTMKLNQKEIQQGQQQNRKDSDETYQQQNNQVTLDIIDDADGQPKSVQQLKKLYPMTC